LRHLLVKTVLRLHRNPYGGVAFGLGSIVCRSASGAVFRCRVVLSWEFALGRLLALLTGVVVVLGVAACAARPTREVLVPVEKAPRYTPKVDMLVATTRDVGQAGDPTSFGTGRSATVNYAGLSMSIPKSHKAGEIEWPGPGTPDPSQQMVVTEQASLGRAEFLQAIAARAAAGGPEASSVLVFVHGYNTQYQEAVYRFAQIIHDSGFQGTAVLFAWPSRGNTALYLADRDASTYSRDYFEATLRDIASLRGVQEVNILAHSMGNWLTLETLRQAKLKGRGDFNGKLGDVVLAAPDVDTDVFRTQLEAIGRLKRPMTVLVSGDDSALKISAILAGGQNRAGQVSASDLEAFTGEVQRYKLRVLDLSAIDGGVTGSHSKFAQAAVVRQIGKTLAADSVSAQNSQSGLVTAVGEIGKSILNVPGNILGVPALRVP
jgi:esterase/lipase superfamily enzyme